MAFLVARQEAKLGNRLVCTGNMHVGECMAPTLREGLALPLHRYRHQEHHYGVSAGGVVIQQSKAQNGWLFPPLPGPLTPSGTGVGAGQRGASRDDEMPATLVGEPLRAILDF